MNSSFFPFRLERDVFVKIKDCDKDRYWERGYDVDYDVKLDYCICP